MKWLVFTITLCLNFYKPVWAADLSQEKIVSNYLSSQSNEEFKESAKSQGSIFSDLNGDGKPELILVWTTLGPTYWHNNLTILSESDDIYKPATSLQLIGEAKLKNVKDGIIFVDQIVYAPNDPICCPTIKKEIQYTWDGSKLTRSNKR